MSPILDGNALAVLRALADPTRLRVAGALAARPRTREALAAELGWSVAALVRPLETLIRAGLVEARPSPSGPLLHLRGDRLGAAARALADLDPEAPPERDPGPLLAGLALGDARIVHGYLHDGRLTTIPAHEGKRLSVLRFLLEQVFTEPREYPEKEVNQRLALFHPDVASLRRYLVDTGLVVRAAGRYRRAVPTVPTVPTVAPEPSPDADAG